jgi:hypothetical protein
MLRALEEQGMAGKVKFIGFDAGPELVKALGEGKMHGIVLQDPVGMASLAVKTMADHLRGKKVEAKISTGETLATPANMSEPAVKKAALSRVAGLRVAQNFRCLKGARLSDYLKTPSERGTVPFFSQGTEKSGRSPSVLR